MPEKYIQRKLFIKESFKKTEFWKKGVIFVNDRIQNPRTEIFSLQDAKIKDKYQYELKTGELKEEIILDETEKPKSSSIAKAKIKYKFTDFGENIIRGALDKFEFYKFDNLKKYFPHLKSVYEFISSPNYLGNIEIEISGPKERINKLTPAQKLKIALFVVKEIVPLKIPESRDSSFNVMFKPKGSAELAT